MRLSTESGRPGHGDAVLGPALAGCAALSHSGDKFRVDLMRARPWRFHGCDPALPRPPMFRIQLPTTATTMAMRMRIPSQTAATPDWPAIRERLVRVARALSARPQDAQEAEDLAQESLARLIAAHARTPTLDPDRIAHRTLVNLFLDRKRRLRRAMARALRWHSAGTSAVNAAPPGPTAALQRSEDVERALGAIDRLPPTQRVVLVLRVLEGLPYEAIAESLGSNVPAVRATLHVARARLARAMEESQ